MAGLAGFLVLLGQGGAEAATAAPGGGSAKGDDALVRALVTAEETGLVLTRKLGALARGLLDLRLPGPSAEASGVFASNVTVVDLEVAPAVGPAAGGGEARGLEFLRSWPVGATREASAVDLWRPLLDAVHHFEHARFVLTRGEHPGGDLLRYEGRADFEGVARMQSGDWRHLEGQVRLDWAREARGDGKPGEWRITGWRTEAMRWSGSSRRWFVESLETALRGPEEAAALRRSLHYEAVVKYYREGMKQMPHPYFAPISVNQKEGLSVVDINGDGFDDLYIGVRLGRNRLLINQRDGTFTEEAERYRLDLPGHTTGAIFADFDNDGDPDAMLGRSLLKTTYLENRGGVFFQHPIPATMPMAVISMAAADYNGDGLLDLYLCTYRPAAPAGGGMSGGFGQVAREGDFDWPDEFFSPELAREFRRRIAEHRQRFGASALDQLGPPNVLLVNRGGGRFEPAPQNALVGLWRNSLQATWGDFNGDGRPDLYIPNDWGMNVLFRNDGPAGFTEVTRDLGLTVYGFSMGASWGDFDHDGRDDLYVSNMHSEAGRRLTARIEGLDPQFAESAMGNFLYQRQADGRFRQVAGLEPPSMTVMKAGWSWGGCFVDFDNDSFLDLYVLNGYFSAPAELDSGLDLESNLWRTMVRADANLARPGFRFSPEWRRTPPPDNLGPQIDLRLSGIERRGDRILVHSLHGHERNRYFANRGGKAFADVSGLSGLDNPADSRGFVAIDYDRDGWQDVALVNANQPLFNLYRNEMPAAGVTGGLIAVRFVGGNRSSAPSREFACRDGYGARVTVDLGDQRIGREHRCGEGWSVQNSATMLIGIGARTNAVAVSVRWPSGRTSATTAVPEGTLLTVHENPADSPTGEAFTRQPYRVGSSSGQWRTPTGPVFPVRLLDPTSKPARLRVYTTFATASPASTADLPVWRRLNEALSAEGVDLVAVPIDRADDNSRLAAYARQWKPPVRLVNVPIEKRPEAVEAFAKVFGREFPLPSSVVTDEAGHLMATQAGLPSVSALRALLVAEH